METDYFDFVLFFFTFSLSFAIKTPGGSALSKYEASELTSEKCQGSSVHEKVS